MMTFDNKVGAGWRTLFAQFPIELVIALLGCMISTLLLWVLVPLEGSLLLVALGVTVLVILPGLLLIIILGVTASKSPLAVIALSFVAGLGIVEAVSFLAIMSGFSASIAGRVIAVVNIALLVVLIIQWRRGTLSVFDFSKRSRAAWQADLFVVLVAVLIAAVNLLEVQKSMPTVNMDWATYMKQAGWMAAYPGETFQPKSEYPTEFNARLTTSGWMAVNAVLSDIFRSDISILTITWNTLPPILIVLSFFAVYSVATELFTNPGAQAAAVLFQLISIITTVDLYQYSQIGYSVLFQMGYDKIALAYLVVPAASYAVLLFIKQRGIGYLVPIALAGAASAMIHPLGLPSVVLVAGGYLAMVVLARPSLTNLKDAALVLAVLLPWIVVPLLQQSAYSPEDNFFLGYSLQDFSSTMLRQGTRNRFTILSLADNNYIVALFNITRPLVAAGVVVGIALGLNIRKSDTARFLFGSTLAVFIVCFTPWLTPLIGKIVSVGMLYRFTWLFPTSLALAWMSYVLVRWTKNRLEGATQGVRLTLIAIVLIGLAGASGFAAALSHTMETVLYSNALHEIHSDSIAVAKYLQQHGKKGDTVLAPATGEYNAMIMSLNPDIKVAYYQRLADEQRYQIVNNFYASDVLRPESAELLITRSVDYVVVPHGSSVYAALDTSSFEILQQFQHADLYYVRRDANLAYAFFNPVITQHDYDSLMQTIIARGGNDALVLLDTPGPWEQLQEEVVSSVESRFHRGPRIIALANDVTDERISNLISGHDRVYVITWGEGMQDPQRTVERIVSAHTYTLSIDWFGKLRLITVTPVRGEETHSFTNGAHFGDSIYLNGWTITKSTPKAGDYLGVSLVWKAISAIDMPYIIGVYIMDKSLQRIIAQHDSQPMMGLFPTNVWSLGETVVDNHVLIIPADAPTDELALVLAIYDSVGQRLPASPGESDGTLLWLTGINIQK